MPNRSQWWRDRLMAATWWVIFRILRWVFWLATIAYFSYVWVDHESHVGQFGNLLHTTEALMFCLPLGAIFAGFFEQMMRERAGLPRPTFSRTMHPQDLPVPVARDRL
jgi:hypothetical protein